MSRIAATPAFRIVGVKGPTLVAVPVKGLSVGWPEAAGATGYRLRYRLKGDSWKAVSVRRPPKIICPLPSGVWQFSLATVTADGRGAWSPTVEVTI